jgi:hypothetical protein
MTVRDVSISILDQISDFFDNPLKIFFLYNTEFFDDFILVNGEKFMNLNDRVFR